ncbi:MAG: hypothetical protein KIS92_22860 [Planctomycetota bacterium]|nr:hypothetical protein [Planctomycetota bacterium]
MGLVLGMLPFVLRAEDDGLNIQPKEAHAAASTAAASAEAPADAPKAVEPKDLPVVLKSIKDGPAASGRAEGLKRLAQTRFTPIPKDVSEQLLRSALVDDDENVRNAAVDAMHDLKDTNAKQSLVAAAVHPKLDEAKRKRAAQGVRRLDEPNLVAAIVTMVSYDIRTGTATEFTVPARTATISNPAIPISLPVELPDVELRSVSTSIAVYGVIALREIARRDVGADPAAWKKWFEEWKQIHEVRMAQEAKAKP